MNDFLYDGIAQMQAEANARHEKELAMLRAEIKRLTDDAAHVRQANANYRNENSIAVREREVLAAKSEQMKEVLYSAKWVISAFNKMYSLDHTDILTRINDVLIANDSTAEAILRERDARTIEEVANWIKPQRNSTPATGEEFAESINRLAAERRA